MNRAKESKYLLSNMNSVESEIEYSIRLEDKMDFSSTNPAHTNASDIYHFDANGASSGAKRNYRKWIRENLMLLSTLGAVVIGVIVGER